MKPDWPGKLIVGALALLVIGGGLILQPLAFALGAVCVLYCAALPFLLAWEAWKWWRERRGSPG